MPSFDSTAVSVLILVAGFLARSLYDTITRRVWRSEETEVAEAKALLREQRVTDLARADSQDREIQVILQRLGGLEKESQRDAERFHELRALLQPLTTTTYALDKRLAVLETTVTGWQAALERIEVCLKELGLQIFNLKPVVKVGKKP